MNIIEEYFWNADMALQMNRLDESCQFICQAIEQLDQSHLTLEQLELVWSVIPIQNFVFHEKAKLIY
ncbi:unnamed protein product [Rotaria socialis]|uniref:Uncharacterized protein n=1 Tax=Rotaria socialis TaxID=392032 RepID=A0A821W9W3_9BILA|nr:unnamed protein product [Rotaria socialis]